MYFIREVTQYSITEYRIMRPGDGLVAYTYSDPIKAYIKLARLEFFSQEETNRYLNWRKLIHRLKLHPHAKYMTTLLPCI